MTSNSMSHFGASRIVVSKPGVAFLHIELHVLVPLYCINQPSGSHRIGGAVPLGGELHHGKRCDSPVRPKICGLHAFSIYARPTLEQMAARRLKEGTFDRGTAWVLSTTTR